MKIIKYWEQPVKKQKRVYNTRKRRLVKQRKKSMYIVILIFLAFIIGYLSDSRTFTVINPEVVSSQEVAHSTVIPNSVGDQDFTVSPIEKVNPVLIDNETRIRMIAKELDFEWTDYLIKLARCESPTLNEFETNTYGNKPVGSIDRGIFAINDFWHSEVSNECAFDLNCATRWTIQRINAGYQKEWMCDKLIRF